MNHLAKLVSLIALGCVIIPSLLFASDLIGLDSAKAAALIGTIGWFVATPLWMSKKLPVDAAEVEI